jgi:hypothetical protein
MRFIDCKMNFINLLFVLMVASFGAANAQSVEDVFYKKEMTWYGLDFTRAKFVGSFNEVGPIPAMGGVVKVQTGDSTRVTITGNSEPEVIRDNYFRLWNNVILNEKEKYNLPVYYKKQAVRSDLSIVDKLNAETNPDSMMLPWGTLELTKEQIQAEVNRYDNKGKSGLGLVYIVESFNKSMELATVYVTFFDMATNKVLIANRLQTKPRGMGLRNYWATAIHRVMVESHEHWKQWKKEARVK